MSLSPNRDDAELHRRSPLSTWDLLTSLGFVADKSVISDEPGGLSIDFGNFKLTASYALSRYFRPVVILGGVMSDSRSIALVECEMPREVETWRQGVAWVTWCLDSHADAKFQPALPVAWLTEGRENRNLLPWERDRAENEGVRAAYDARPRCAVLRDWARVALRNLAEQLLEADDNAPVTLHFDGEILTVRAGGSAIALPASGTPWPSRYTLTAESLRQLPKRLNAVVEFSIWESFLTIGNRRYSGVVAIDPEKGM